MIANLFFEFRNIQGYLLERIRQKEVTILKLSTCDKSLILVDWLLSFWKSCLQAHSSGQGGSDGDTWGWHCPGFIVHKWSIFSLLVEHKLKHEEKGLLWFSHASSLLISWRAFCPRIQLRPIFSWADSRWHHSWSLPCEHIGQFNLKNGSIQGSSRRLSPGNRQHYKTRLEHLYGLWRFYSERHKQLSNASYSLPCYGNFIIVPSSVS